MGRTKRSSAVLATFVKVAQRLETARQEYRGENGEKLSKRELHRQLKNKITGVQHYSTLARILAGERRPTPELLTAAAEILGVTPEHLLAPLVDPYRESPPPPTDLPPGARLLPPEHPMHAARFNARSSAKQRRQIEACFGKQIGTLVLNELAWHRRFYPKTGMIDERLKALGRFDQWLQETSTINDAFRSVEGRGRLILAAGRFLLNVEAAMAVAVAECPSIRSPEYSRLSYARFARDVLAVIENQLIDTQPQRRA